MVSLTSKTEALLDKYAAVSRGGLGTIRTYMVTINPELEMDQYHLPKPVELFAKLAGGKKFPLHMPINR